MTQDKELNKIKNTMIKALENKDNNGIMERVCHEDIPETSEFDAHFTVCGEEDKPVYSVFILKVSYE